MADDLKKVGLVFKADGTADFAKSLKTINSLTQENYSSFKLAKSQWDSSTKSMDKLRDTQRYLSSQTDAYTAKVDTLKEELKNLENAENRNEKALLKLHSMQWIFQTHWLILIHVLDSLAKY